MDRYIFCKADLSINDKNVNFSIDKYFLVNEDEFFYEFSSNGSIHNTVVIGKIFFKANVPIINIVNNGEKIIVSIGRKYFDKNENHIEDELKSLVYNEIDKHLMSLNG